MAKKKYKKGEMIIEEGTPGQEMYIIKSGRARVFKTIDKKATELGELKQDDFFGEMCLFLHYPRSASVQAIETTEILTCDKESFLEMVRLEPELAERILTIIMKRLHEAHNVIIQLEGEKKSIKVMYGIK